MTASDFASIYRQGVKDLYAARQKLKTYIELANPILATLPDGALPGANADITKADLVAAITAAGELESHLTDYLQQPPTPTPTNVALQKML